MSADINEIARAFTTFYYQTFDIDRKNLVSLYREQSMLTFEGQQFAGVNNVVEKLVSLPFQKVQHRVTTVDVQPGIPNIGTTLVSVTGALLIDAEQNTQLFSQIFHLMPEGNSYWVYNDIFRLNYI
ncbi:nuclear transport factor 2 [Backusella circina FSU 941]|nr:nuclear transport factor 2 [Backusella circina FSU 941]